MLGWLQQFSTFCFLDNQEYAVAPHHYECLIGAGVIESVEGEDLDKLDAFLKKRSWVFGHLAYSLSTSIHQFSTTKKDKIGFQPYYFFLPQIVLEIKGALVSVRAQDPRVIFEQICKVVVSDGTSISPISTTPVLDKEEYIKKIHSLQAHIHRGDCYEINFCQEFFAENVAFNPIAAYQKLAAISPNPFSAFYKIKDKYLVCASPERFLAKRGQMVFSQPIKGTIKRNLADSLQDDQLREELRTSFKDRSENVMVVDLVRNDLTRICKEASVKVEELFGIYSYPQVHQMISTISGELKGGVSFSDIIKATFPMGSMTGAPKHRVMQLIEEYEPSVRGIFSGAVGYINPDGDFDFNVVIRSLMYNEATCYLSYQVGSAITFYSDAEKEWNECLLKAEAIKAVLEGGMTDGS